MTLQVATAGWNGPQLAEFCGQYRWPVEAMVLMEGDLGIRFYELGGEGPKEPQRWRKGRAFWERGELRWEETAPGKFGVAYVGEEAAPEVLIAEQTEGIAGSREVNMLIRPPAEHRGDWWVLRLREYIDKYGNVTVSRLLGVLQKGREGE